MKQQTRLYYIDNLRIYLTVLVILHHNAIAYSGSGPWSILDPGADGISSILFTLFTAVNQTYFMAAFFLLAGYFTPRSLENKGPIPFLRDRLIRLGIPVLVYTTLIVNINGFILDRLVDHIPFQIRLEWDVAHLWFLEALLVFSLIYVIYRVINDNAGERKRSQKFRDRFPSDKVLLASIILLGIATFAVRLIIPVGDWYLGIQPGHFLQYIFSFIVGILAYQGNWFDRLSRAQARRWGWAVIPIFLALFPAIVAGGVLENPENLAKFMGGGYWQALAYSIWESAMFIGIAIFLIYIFRERFNITSNLTRFLIANTFTVYIIHQTVLYLLQALGLLIDLPATIKFIIISFITIPLCFLLSYLIRRILYAKRVLR